ncbi:MAG: hypothetical protein PVJ62_04240, partial [Deltaproteobacteria bacterium]
HLLCQLSYWGSTELEYIATVFPKSRRKGFAGFLLGDFALEMIRLLIVERGSSARMDDGES